MRLLDVEAEVSASGTRIALRTDAAPPLTEPFALADPSRLVLDLPRAANAAGSERFEVGSAEVARVRVGRHPGFLRVVLDLTPAGRARRAARRTHWRRRDALVRGGAGAGAAAHVSAEPPPAAPAPPAAPVESGRAPVRIYGVELQAGADRDRVLVFAEAPIAAEVSTPDATTVLVRLPGATLDARAARRITPEVGGAVSEIVAFIPLSKGEPEVRLHIQRSAGIEPLVSRRGAILAVEFPLPAGAKDVGLTLSFADAELRDVVQDIARATGERFLFDDQLQGRVNVSVVNRVTPEEAVQILHAALLSKGFAAVPSPGGAWRILAASEAPGAAPFTSAAPGASSVPPVTTLVRLRSADAKQLVATLARFAGSEISATAYAPSNSVILAGSEARLHRYLSLVQALDDAQGEELAVIELRHRAAAEVAGMLAEVAKPRARAPGRDEQRPRFEVWHDVRSNALLLRGTTERLAELRAWLAELDVPPEGEGSVRVIRPRHADPLQLADVLEQLSAGSQIAAPRPRSAAALGGRSFHVAVHESSGALLVQADPETQRVVRDVIDEIDRLPATVAIDLMVFEVTTSRSLALGFDALLPFGDADENLAGAVLVQGTPGGPLVPAAEPGIGVLRYAKAPLLIPILGPGGIPTVLVVPQETVQITAAEGTVGLRTLLRPHLLALSGEEHELVVGDNVPVLVGATDAAGEAVVTDPLTIENDIERKDVGMILRVRPTAGQQGDVRLELDVEVSRVRPESAVLLAKGGAVIEQRKLTLVTRLEHGQVAVLGMLQAPVSQEREVGVPFLKDIPILGWLARSTLSERMDRQLVIAVQAEILRSEAEIVADSIQQRIGFERALARRGRLARSDEDTLRGARHHAQQRCGGARRRECARHAERSARARGALGVGRRRALRRLPRRLRELRRRRRGRRAARLRRLASRGGGAATARARAAAAGGDGRTLRSACGGGGRAGWTGRRSGAKSLVKGERFLPLRPAGGRATTPHRPEPGTSALSRASAATGLHPAPVPVSARSGARWRWRSRTQSHSLRPRLQLASFGRSARSTTGTPYRPCSAEDVWLPTQASTPSP